MAIENMTVGMPNIDMVELLSSIPGISNLIKLAQIAIVVVIAYIAFLIFRGILQLRRAFQLKKVAQSVEEINQKMDILVGRRGKVGKAIAKEGKKLKKSKK